MKILNNGMYQFDGLACSASVKRVNQADKVLDRYQEFTAKLTEFQQNGGTSPTPAEFEVWRDDIRLMWAIKEEGIKAESAALVPQPQKAGKKPSDSSYVP